MRDHFATLGVGRRLWLDAGELKQMFHRLSAECHPDVLGVRDRAGGGGAGFSELNESYRVLREHGLRLGHWLDLLGWQGGGGFGSGGLGEVFMELGVLVGETRGFLERAGRAGGVVEKALMAGEMSGLRGRWESLGRHVEDLWRESEGILRALDSRLEAAGDCWDDVGLGEVARLRQRFLVLGKWREQVREALFNLGLA